MGIGNIGMHMPGGGIRNPGMGIRGIAGWKLCICFLFFLFLLLLLLLRERAFSFSSTVLASCLASALRRFFGAAAASSPSPSKALRARRFEAAFAPPASWRRGRVLCVSFPACRSSAGCSAGFSGEASSPESVLFGEPLPCPPAGTSSSPASSAASSSSTASSSTASSSTGSSSAASSSRGSAALNTAGLVGVGPGRVPSSSVPTAVESAGNSAAALSTPLFRPPCCFDFLRFDFLCLFKWAFDFPGPSGSPADS
mmetsp:Transcript_57432/g.168160  ORF Transcript_57432/g.168160 Transcript_57432/m.168160 type:complete len:255 (-) Transcript_57432:618-1382(-)